LLLISNEQQPLTTISYACVSPMLSIYVWTHVGRVLHWNPSM
jgi:hypothetical protein